MLYRSAASAIASSAGGPTGVTGMLEDGIESAYFLPDLQEHRRLIDFLELSYHGGAKYKFGTDSRGYSILVEHENESGGAAGQTLGSYIQDASNKAITEGVDVKPQGRFQRRQRVAAYQNHVKPIVDKITAYLTRTTPQRDEGLTANTDEMDRLKLDYNIDSMIAEGLRRTEAWIGFDTVPVESMIDEVSGDEFVRVNGAMVPRGQLTQAMLEQIDPMHGGRPYIVRADARRIVDFDEDEETCEITRVVIEEIEITKGSLSKPKSETLRFREWTETEWVLWEQVVEKNKKDPVTTASIVDGKRSTTGLATFKIREVDRQQHNFGRCPWFRFRPEFPTEDIAELNRAIFNLSSLLDEELYTNTFTQKWVSGANVDEVRKIVSGAGNVWVFQDSQAKAGTFGAVPGQAKSLMDRISQLMDALYMLVSMEGTKTKNVSETAEKKKRDLEALYTLLVKIVGEVERVENDLLFAMGVLGDSKDSTPTGHEPVGDKPTTYERQFDVTTLEELLTQIQDTFRLPFIPPSFKKELVGQLFQKVQPFADHEAIRKDMDTLMDTSPELVEAVVELWREGMITPELVARRFAVPPNDLEEFLARLSGHIVSTEGASSLGEGNQEAQDNVQEETIETYPNTTSVDTTKNDGGTIESDAGNG